MMIYNKITHFVKNYIETLTILFSFVIKIIFFSYGITVSLFFRLGRVC